jgi:nicotinate phosphoribosyltransferase
MNYEILLQKVIEKGNIVSDMPDMNDIIAYKKERFAKLHSEFKRFDNPHIFKVGISESLLNTRNKLLNAIKD